MKKNQFTSLRGLFAAVFAAVCVVFASVVFASCQAGEDDDWTPTPMAKVWSWTNSILFCNGEPVFYGGVEQKFPIVELLAEKQGNPSMTTQGNPNKVSESRTETNYGYADGQEHLAFTETFGDYQVSAQITPNGNGSAERINDHMTRVKKSYNLSGYYVNQNYEVDVTVPFEAEIQKEWIEADNSVKIDTVVNVIKETVVKNDTVITYVDNYIYQTDTVLVEKVKKDTVVVEKVVEVEVEKVVVKHDTIINNVVVTKHDTIEVEKEVVKEVPVEKIIEVPVEVHDSIYVTLRDTVTVEKTEEVIKYIEKYLDKDLNRHSYLGGAWATLRLDGELLVDFNLGLAYQTLEVEKNIWGSNIMTREAEHSFYFNDGQVATWSVKTKNATIESVTYNNTVFTNTEVGNMKLGKTSFTVKGTYTGIDGKEESFEFELNPYYLQAVKPEPEVKVDVYTYTFDEETVASSNASQWMKNFTVTRYLNGNVDKSWSYKTWIAKIGPVTGTTLHVEAAKVLSENLSEGTSSNRWEAECGKKALTGKNLGFIVDTDCRLYDYEVAFPSTAGGKVEAKSQIAYWTKEISFADPERPDDENGRHTWTLGTQSCTVTKHAIEKVDGVEPTHHFTDTNVTGSYAASYVLTVSSEVGGVSWYSQTAATHLYK